MLNTPLLSKAHTILVLGVFLVGCYINFLVLVRFLFLNKLFYFRPILVPKGVVSMPRKGFTTVAIPDTLMSEIDAVVKSKKSGYTSRAEVVRAGVRVVLKELKK